VPAYSVEAAEDTAAGFELLVGARRDPRFGPVVVVGAGGIHAEVLRDTAVAAAPVDAVAAEALLRSLACAPLLEGARSRPPLDLAAAADAVVALSRFAAAHPEIAELEVNPLLVRREGAVGLDARIVLELGET
jgi:acetate---CoA ligase (ADP-forming)